MEKKRMKLLFKTSTSEELKSDIISLIENKALKTWEIYRKKNSKGESLKRLKHKDQWNGYIRLTSDIKKEGLLVEVFGMEKTVDVKDFEGYYLGRFCEIIFVNFPNEFNIIEKIE